METEQIIRYGAKPGAGFDQEAAQEIGAELERVSRGRPFQGVTPPELVEAAQSGEAPAIAARLTWDDRVAAHHYRVSEARHIVNHILVVEQAEDNGEPVRAYHAVRVEVDADEPGGGSGATERRYVPLAVVQREVKLARQVIEEARNELLRATAKLRLYEDHVASEHPELARVARVVEEELGDEEEQSPRDET